MPRRARLDATGAIHHVIVRGIDHRRIFDDDGDRRNFVSRMAKVAVETDTAIYAWALLPNHAHILLRSGPLGISKYMRRLLTGHAVYYNRRHERQGYLFQNRYKSILCEEEVYFKELIRYVHLNPLRAGIVDNLGSLGTYPWCGHSYIMRRAEYSWHDVSFVLSQFGSRSPEARRRYRKYLEDALRQDAVGEAGSWRPDWSLLEWLKGIRIAGDWNESGRDGCVLGGETFARSVIRRKRTLPAPDAELPEDLILDACKQSGLSVDALLSGSRRSDVAGLRAQLVLRLVDRPGITLTRLGRLVGISRWGVSKILARRT